MTLNYKHSLVLVIVTQLLFSIPQPGYSQKYYEEIVVLDFFESLYEYNFSTSKTKLEQVIKKTKNQPEAYISSANFYWWMMMTGNNNKENALAFENANKELITKYKSNYPEELSSDELFAVIHGYAYQTRFALHKRRYLRGLSNLKRIMPYLEEVLENPLKNEKFSLLAGLYHYLAAVTIEEKPLLKPFFKKAPESNRKLGYQLLISASQSSHPLISNEAKYFLMKINLEISKNYFEAIRWNRSLIEQFPDNILYRFHYLQSLVLLNRATDAKDQFIIIRNLSENLPGLTKEQRSHFVDEASRLLK